MKTTTKVTNVTHEDLVNLFSTALYCGDIFEATYNKTEYKNCEPKNDDCLEDKLARVLLHGYSITVVDRNAEDKDEHYGTLPYEWNKKFGEMEYTVTLKDIERGIEKALDCKNVWITECAYRLINEPHNFDLLKAEKLLQWIVFGESIYV